MADFSGFPSTTLRFLRGIAENNGKDWFEAHRDLYEAGYVAPATAFVEALGPKLRAISPEIRFEPRINGSIARINRDTRFSTDKRPYKDHLDIWFWHGDKRGWEQPGFYLRITPEQLWLGSGMHGFDKPMLARFREAVLAEPSGAALVKTLAQVRTAGPYEIGGKTRTKVPRGFDGAHARAEFLLFEGLYAGLTAPTETALQADFVKVCETHFAATWPVAAWLREFVTGD